MPGQIEPMPTGRHAPEGPERVPHKINPKESPLRSGACAESSEGVPLGRQLNRNHRQPKPLAHGQSRICTLENAHLAGMLRHHENPGFLIAKNSPDHIPTIDRYKNH